MVSLGGSEGEGRRKAKADKFGVGLMDKLSWPPYKWEVFGPPWVFFREAVICYVNGQFMAFSLMTRAAIETAIYLAISIDIYANETDMKKINLDYTNERDWSKILHEAEKRGYLTKKDIVNINFIRNYGNIVAHWGQKVHFEIRNKQHNTNKQRIRPDSIFTFASTTQGLNLSKFIISETKATTIMRKGVNVLESLADRI
jgi:hypothetical protein